MLDEEIRAHYETGIERGRLAAGSSRIEFERTKELLRRFLAPPPGRIVDVGGGPGAYASWLASAGYDVHLVDPVPLHVEQAREASASQPEHGFSAALGDARRLDAPDAGFDAALLLGPLYHLTERADRVAALTEARRVVKPGGLVAAAAISRFASLLDGLARGYLGDENFRAGVERDLPTGQHRNPTRHPDYFTTAYFHHPHELPAEVEEAGLVVEGVFGIEGPGWLLPDAWDDAARRAAVVFAARAVEQEPTLLGLSAHLLVAARRRE